MCISKTLIKNDLFNVNKIELVLYLFFVCLFGCVLRPIDIEVI